MNAPPSCSNNTMRYHGLDLLRAAMMFLGIVLHAGGLYSPYPNETDIQAIAEDPLNPFRDVAALDMTVQRILWVIHFFRMPAFMLLAGFFAALLMEKRGTGHLIKNRTQRIFVPLILFWFFLWPIDRFAWSTGKDIMLDETRATSLSETLQNNLSQDHLPLIGNTAPHTMHLWFIYYLVIFYLISIPIIHLIQKKLPSVHGCFNRLLDFIFSTRAKVLIVPALILLSFATLKTEGNFHYNVSFDFFPGVPILLNFFVFFIAGWVMYIRRDVIEHFKRWVWIYTPLAVLLLGGTLWAGETHWHYEKLLANNGGSKELLIKKAMYMDVATTLQAGCVWIVIFSLIGLTEKYITRPNKKTTYFVYSSYWVYLFHRPLCTGFAALIARWDMPGLIKFAIVIAIVSAVCIVTYHFLIRNTWVGLLLNGKKNP